MNVNQPIRRPYASFLSLSPRLVFALNTITFGMVTYHWLCTVWSRLRALGYVRLHPVWFILATFVPFLGVFVVYWEFRALHRFAREANFTIKTPAWLLTAGYVAPLIIASRLLLLTPGSTMFSLIKQDLSFAIAMGLTALPVIILRDVFEALIVRTPR